MELTKTKKVLLVAAIIISNIAVMGDYAVYPIVDGLYEIFGDKAGWVDTWVSMPQWVQVVFSFAAAALMGKMSTKNVLILGGVCFTIGGLGGAAIQAIEFMTFMRFLFGVGIALVNVAGVSILTDAFPDEVEYNKVMGYYNAGQALVATIISAVAGNLAVVGWTHVFLIFIAAIAMTVMFVVCVPNLEEAVGEQEAGASTQSWISPVFWLASVAVIIFSIAYAIGTYYVSSYVAENGIGDEVTAGYLGSIGTVGSFVFCLVYGRVYERLHRWIAAVAYGFAAILMVVLWLMPSTMVAYGAYLFLGITMGVCASYSYGIVPELCSEDRIDFGIAVQTAIMCLGYAVASYFVSFCQGAMGTELYTPMYGIGAVCAAIACGVEILSHAGAFQKQG